MVLDCVDLILVEGSRLTRHAKGSVLGMPPGPARNLRQLLRVEWPHPSPVEFCGGRKRDVLDVEIETHADGIGSNKVIHVAVLIQSHLGVPGARRQRPHHHRAATLLPPDQFRNRIDVFDREADNGTSGRHPADLPRPGAGQRRHPLAFKKRHMRHEPGNRAAHGVRAKKQRLMQTTGPQQPVGEDVPAVEIGAQLDLVDCHEIRTDL